MNECLQSGPPMPMALAVILISLGLVGMFFALRELWLHWRCATVTRFMILDGQFCPEPSKEELVRQKRLESLAKANAARAAKRKKDAEAEEL